MAKLATLTDDFQDGVIDTSKWRVVSGTVAETGGRIKLTPSTTTAIFATIGDTYDFTGSHVIAHVPVVTSNGSTGSLQSIMAVRKDSSNATLIGKRGSELVCSKLVGGVETHLAFTPFNATSHLFWRLRTDSSNIYWETSATGTSFTIQHTASIASLGFPITLVGFYLATDYVGTEFFPGTFQAESVNPGLPLRASGSSTSTGSLALQITAPLSLTAAGSSTSTGSLTFTPLPASTVSMSASGTSTSTGSLALTIPAPPLPPVMPAGTWYFEPPVVNDLPPTLPGVRHRVINSHAKWKGGQRRGRSVLKLDGVYQIIDTPTVDQTHAATEVYMGGHIYQVPVDIAYQLHLLGLNVYAGTDILTTESGDILTTESGDPLTAEYSFGSS